LHVSQPPGPRHSVVVVTPCFESERGDHKKREMSPKSAAGRLGDLPQKDLLNESVGVKRGAVEQTSSVGIIGKTTEGKERRECPPTDLPPKERVLSRRQG